MREYLHHEHLGEMPSEAEVRAATDFCNGSLSMQGDEEFNQADAFEIILQIAVRDLGPMLQARIWTVEVAPSPILITSDAPLSIWAVPDPSHEYTGIGIANAAEIRFSVGPSHLLVLKQSGFEGVKSMSTGRARAVNARLAKGCAQFVIGQPARKGALETLDLGSRGPKLRFNEGPLYVGDRLAAPASEIIHSWVEREAQPVRE